jgi:hypothetical protein
MMFTVASQLPRPRIAIKRGLSLKAIKEGPLQWAEDKRESIVVHFGPHECTLPRGRIANYIEASDEARNQLSIRDTNWRWSVIRAEEETIHIICERNVGTKCVSERVFPVLLPSSDSLSPASMNQNLGLWSKNVQPLTIQTKAMAEAAAVPAKLTGEGSGVERRTIEPRIRMASGAAGQVIPVEKVRHIQIRRNGSMKRI